MNAGQYWKNRLPFVCIQLLSMAALSVFLLINGNSTDVVALILFVWAVLLIVCMLTAFWMKKKRLDRLLALADKVEEKYLISEIAPKPMQAEEEVWHRLLKLAGRSMLEQIGEVKQERKEYREYIEQWIHEIKTPLTAIQLLCENNRSEPTREILGELEKVSRYVEQTLYYARSGHTEKDYSIKPVCVEQVIHQAVTDNKYLLLKNQVTIQIEAFPCTVYSDEKWLRFLLNQLIVNAVKYKDKDPVLKFCGKEDGARICLLVEDNGIGICPEDLPRIFEKGFTGKNGRKSGGSTGLGLYLCKCLCRKLGMEIQAEPLEKGTRMILSFYRNDYIYQVQEK